MARSIFWAGVSIVAVATSEATSEASCVDNVGDEATLLQMNVATATSEALDGIDAGKAKRKIGKGKGKGKAKGNMGEGENTAGYVCDTTLDQRNQIRAQVLAELEGHGFVSARSDSIAPWSSAEGDEVTEKPSSAMAYQVNPGSISYQMGSPKDAIVWVGCSPPPGAWYFGCTKYLNSMGTSSWDLLTGPMASMTDSMNHLNIQTTGEEFWESTFVMITAADAQTATVVREALEHSHPALARAINIQIIPTQLNADIRLEMGEEGASFSTGCRLAPGRVSNWATDTQDRAAAYMASVEPLLILDGSQSLFPLQPFATPLARQRASGNQVEVQLRGAYDQLVCQVQQRAFDMGFVATREDSTHEMWPLPALGEDFELNGTQCIVEGGNCFQDDPSCLYMKTHPPGAPMQVLVEVNHRLTGTASYGYTIAYGTFTVHDHQTEGSALPWAGNLPESNLFSVVTLMQDENACSDLPEDIRGWCYEGDGCNGDVKYVSRAYLSPNTETAPDKNELLPGTVLNFRRLRRGRLAALESRPVCAASSL
jgi:hypothetical protein